MKKERLATSRFCLTLGILISLFIMSACRQIDLGEDEGNGQDYDDGCVEVKVRMGNFNISSSPISMSRAEGTEYPEGVTAISIAAFNENNVRVDSVKAIKDLDNETFNAPLLRLPPGNYTFVAVAHGASSTDIEAATIESPELVRLHETRIYETFSCVKSDVSVMGSAMTINLAMGKRKNAQFALETLDVVPNEIVSVWIKINAEANTTVPLHPGFNPATGVATGNWLYSRNFSVQQGAVVYKTFGMLLPAADYNMSVSITPVGENKTEYTQLKKIFSDVTFSQNTLVRAVGYLFSTNTSFEFTFDTDWEPENTLPF